jgi:hypothetical protein
MHQDPSFEPLPAAEGGPSLVVRHDNTILRPVQPWTATIHALLRHLEAVGFTGAPRVVGDGYDGRGNEVLTYIEGEVAHPNSWSDDGIWRVGRLLRELHDATASFQPPEDAVWQPWYFHSDAPGSIVGHCDTGPWHVVARDGRPVAFIDWTLAGPTDRRDEIAARPGGMPSSTTTTSCRTRRFGPPSFGASSTAMRCRRPSGSAWSPT